MQYRINNDGTVDIVAPRPLSKRARKRLAAARRKAAAARKTA